MSNIEKIKPQKHEAEEKENVRTWQDDLNSQPHLDSNSTIVERQLQRSSYGFTVNKMLCK
ncbi:MULTISPECIES: hypothetical protein [Enterobacteriaceae]|uniref:hypothetical protein n=1 Tax=Enterobacteriaceae TaxID=543 RepID=UPI0004512E5B|nr:MULTISPECIES: hypothetical protein [Enterobacter cloacae complex]ELZ1063217.1 hypothetical protein [Escherichia coli]HAS0803279.1 hypothetical protein [Enterobacter roggenkampii]EUM64145.1 hypothetical protein L359_05773 [Enterobacter hormaechei subsp. hoffmannii MGH 13]EUM93353.1 hypothetical protein L350_07080 [Enterobacter sp. MGH 4]HAT7722044.1 hypothetical protein [Enterobacter roggenkampii]